MERAVRKAASGRHAVLAVSGGRDSMALLHAAAASLPGRLATVATFDHGTGPDATRAAELAAEEATRLGFGVVVGRSRVPGATEAAWRADRHAFLGEVAHGVGGIVMTAHTRDDQLETVLMRVMRGTGPRGLAALYAKSAFARPLLVFTRAEVASYAVAVGARWVEDPTNASMRFLRNRVRRDLLPALTRVAPDLDRQLLDLSRAAAAWRERIEAAAATLASVAHDCVSVDADALRRYSPEALAVLWPAIAARAGVVMDWRGTERAAAFTRHSRPGARIQLSGGWELSRKHRSFELRRTPDRAACWRLVATTEARPVSDNWVAMLPAGLPLTVRPWQAGDRMRGPGGELRKVKRFLSDAHVSGTHRATWPVVLAGDEIVWIPGVRRSDAAAVRPGRPGVLYHCELAHD